MPELYCNTCETWKAIKGNSHKVGECCYKGSDFYVRGASVILMTNEKHYCTCHALKEELLITNNKQNLIQYD